MSEAVATKWEVGMQFLDGATVVTMVKRCESGCDAFSSIGSHFHTDRNTWTGLEGPVAQFHGWADGYGPQPPRSDAAEAPAPRGGAAPTRFVVGDVWRFTTGTREAFTVGSVDSGGDAWGSGLKMAYASRIAEGVVEFVSHGEAPCEAAFAGVDRSVATRLVPEYTAPLPAPKPSLREVSADGRTWVDLARLLDADAFDAWAWRRVDGVVDPGCAGMVAAEKARAFRLHGLEDRVTSMRMHQNGKTSEPPAPGPYVCAISEEDLLPDVG